MAKFHGPRMVAIGFIAQSLAIGPTYGAFGPLLGEFERMFDMSRAMVSLPLSLVVLANGLLAPVIGSFVERFTIRRTLMLGALLLTVGYLVLAMARSGVEVLMIYGLLIGPGVALLGMLPNATLVTNWYTERQGTMLGIVNMPLMVMVVPLAVAWLLPDLGFRGILVMLAAMHAVALPALWFVIERPEAIGQRPFGDARPFGDKQAAIAGAVADGDRPIPMMRLLVVPLFLLTTFGAGLAVGAGVSKMVHLVPLVTERGWSLQQAALLMSISGGTGVVGALMFGWLADRIGGAGALVINCVTQAIIWLILILPVGFGVLIVDAVIIGMCGGGLITAKAVLVTRIFGRASFSRVMGLSGLMNVPFLFGLSPVAGILRDLTGDYVLAVWLHIAGFIIGAICFVVTGLMIRNGRGMPASLPAPAATA